MAGDTIITIVGNLTKDPELRFTPSGAAVASFTVASTPRTESLTKGTRVIVQGRLVQRSYTTREGENRTVVEMQVDEIGSVRNAYQQGYNAGRQHANN